jgi:hypothetical protein
MSYAHTNIAAAPVGDANGFLESTNMKVGDYTLLLTAPTFGARHVTCTRTVVGNADTPGTLILTGRDLSGQTITEMLVVGAHTIVVTSTKLLAHLDKATGAGWVVDVGTTTPDTLEIGWDNVNAVMTSGGTLHAIVINATAAGAITVADAAGTIATIPSNVAVGTFYLYDAQVAGYLRVEPAAASNITILHSGSMPAYPNG